jgi:transposase-like protein
MPSPFEDDSAARAVLEALRWPDGPRCPRCGSGGVDAFLIGGRKHSHRHGLYHCKPCRRQFSVTVGTPLERLRIPLSTWMRAAREFSADNTHRAHNARRKDNLVPLCEIAPEIGVSYRTVLRMRDIIKRAARKYRGHKKGFGAWPRSLMIHKNARSEQTIRASGVLASFVPAHVKARRPALDRTEQLLRLILATPKRTPRKRRSSGERGGVEARSL